MPNIFRRTEQSTYKGRVEIGGVYLPSQSQLERTPQL
jgi:hypothetical protein